MAPRVVVEGPATAFDRAVREVAAAGWRPRAGFGGPFAGNEDVRIGPVDSEAAAEAALLAALADKGLVVHATAGREVIDRLVDDLRRLGPVDHRSDDDGGPPALDPVALAILRQLAAGATLGQAAQRAGVSRRTADRRLAAARRLLGVTRTTEAMAAARRLGWLSAGDDDPA